jgi:hypothetical protein
MTIVPTTCLQKDVLFFIDPLLLVMHCDKGFQPYFADLLDDAICRRGRMPTNHHHCGLNGIIPAVMVIATGCAGSVDRLEKQKPRRPGTRSAAAFVASLDGEMRYRCRNGKSHHSSMVLERLLTQYHPPCKDIPESRRSFLRANPVRRLLIDAVRGLEGGRPTFHRPRPAKRVPITPGMMAVGNDPAAASGTASRGIKTGMPDRSVDAPG